MREFTLGPMSESRSAPGGHQLAGHTAYLNFWVCVVLLLNHEVDAHSPITIPWRMEGWVDHRHCSKCAAMPKAAYIAVILWKTQKLVRSLGSIMAPLTLQASMLPLNHCNMWLWLISGTNWTFLKTQVYVHTVTRYWPKWYASPDASHPFFGLWSLS